MQKGYSNIQLIFWVLGGLILLFIVSPLLSLALQSNFPEIQETLMDKEVTDSIFLTIWVSISATAIFAIAAIPLAYLLARKNFFGKNFVNAVIDIPVMIPHSAAGIALLGFLSRNSTLGSAAENLGISFVGNPVGIGLAMAFVSLPFLINAARDGFSKVPVQLEKAAHNLGASTFRSFILISVPLAKRSIVTGLIMMFARGLSEFGAVIIVAYHPMTTPVLIYERFTAYGLSYARPVALIFIVVSLIVFAAMRYYANRKSHLSNV